MRFYNILHLLPFTPTRQFSLSSTANVGSSIRHLSYSPVPPLPHLTSDLNQHRIPTQTVSSSSPLLNTAILPRSLVPILLDSRITPPPPLDGTVGLSDSTLSLSDVCQGLIEDSDITGLGVRITFYVTSILTVINACVPGCDAKGSAWATLFTFVALMVSAIAQAANHSISLYNATIVLYLCFLHQSCTLTLISGALLRKKFGAPVPKTGFVTRTIFSHLPHWSWHAFGLYVWAHASSFGSQPECNPATKLIVFGREFSATGSGRVVSLVFFSLSATMFLSVPVITVVGISLIIKISVAPLIGSLSRRLPAGRPRTPFNGVLFIDIYITLCFVIQWIYVVVTIEQTIQRNPVIQAGPRFPISFGQIFPVVTIGACFVSIYNDVQEYRRTPPISESNEPDGPEEPTKADV